MEEEKQENQESNQPENSEAIAVAVESGKSEEKPQDEDENTLEESVSEKIKALNLYLRFLATVKPIIYDKCIQTGGIASALFGILNMESDVININSENKISLTKDDLLVAAYLSNAGFVGIPEYVLSKPGSLSDNEYNIVKEHVRVSANICSIIAPEVFTVVVDHHELPLARGYNKKMAGVARSSYVIGIADRFIGSLHMMGSLYRPANSRVDAVNNAINMFDATSQVFSIDQINQIADFLLQY